MSRPNTCPDCGTRQGEAHADGCDVARCLWTGQQRLQCDYGLVAECSRALAAAGRDALASRLADYYGLDDLAHDCGDDTWTGQWPGLADAARLDLWCYWGPGWQPCDGNHPEARPDLNRLHTRGRWDRIAGRWVAA
jgi:hypothetical protein